MRRGQHVAAVLAFHQPPTRQVADAVVDHLLTGVDRHHPGHRKGFFQIEAVDARPRVRAAAERPVQLTRLIDVVGVGAVAGDEPDVFPAPY